MKYIIAAGLLQVIIALLLLFLNSRKEKSDYLLATLLTGIGWHLITKFYIFTEVENPAILFRMHTFIQLSYGPLLYLYATKKCNEQFLPARLWFLFIPLIISMTLYGCVVAAFSMYPDKSDFVLAIYNSIVFLPIVGAHVVFGILVGRKVKNTEISDYLLIRNLSWILILVGFTEILLKITSNNFPVYILLIRSILYILLGLIPVLIIRYKYVAMPKQPEMGSQRLAFEPGDRLSNTEQEISKSLANTTFDQVERKLLLDSVQHQEIYNVIESFVREKYMYREEDFSLDKLAGLSGYSRHYISETLNVFAQKSFYQYINEYRINEVISLLSKENDKNVSILSMAYHAGFKNKASFNQYFKKITGSTPSQYQKTNNSCV